MNNLSNNSITPIRSLVQDNLVDLLKVLPQEIAHQILSIDNAPELLEIIFDVGRFPQARYVDHTVQLGQDEIAQKDIDNICTAIGDFGGDNRAGIQRTLHRISAIKNRSGSVIGLTLRVGRAIYGTIKIIDDLIMSGKSVLLLGRPGVGKTTMLREVARVLAEKDLKRVIVVDTSNEIAGDGDIPHDGIGGARRMQVPSPSNQHSVMIEAVENHMPEVIVIDEIGNEDDAAAARTIAERGVQLIATAHGNTLDNLILNPTLSDLVGGIESVTLGDIEAQKRRTQKTVRERKAPPTFDILVEIRSWDEVAIHSDVASVVDKILRGINAQPEIRSIATNGEVVKNSSSTNVTVDHNIQPQQDASFQTIDHFPETKLLRILAYGVNRGKLLQAIEDLEFPMEVVKNIEQADILLTTKSYYRRQTKGLQIAQTKGCPVYVLRKNTLVQIQQFIKAIMRKSGIRADTPQIKNVVVEAEQAVKKIVGGESQIELMPQGSFIRKIQHQIAQNSSVVSTSTGKEPNRRVVFYKQ